jgi:hypothetical protein
MRFLINPYKIIYYFRLNMYILKKEERIQRPKQLKREQ